MATTKDRRSWWRKAFGWIKITDPANPQYVTIIPNPDAGGNFNEQYVLTNLDLFNVVQSVVSWIAGEVSKPPLVLHRRNRSGVMELVPDHPMLKVLRNPRPGEYGGRTLREAIEAAMLICGNAYIRKVRFNGGASKMQLQFVPPWVIRPKWGNDGYITHYERDRGNAAPERIEKEDIIHLRHKLDLRNPTMGVSPFRNLGREIWTDDRASIYTAALLKNHGRPGLIMSVPAGTDPLSKEVRDETREYINEQFTGQNVGETMFMGVPLDIKTMGLNPSEMSLTNVRNTVEERVCAAGKTPAVVIGFHSGIENANTRANLQDSQRQAWQNAVIPDQESIAEQLLMQLLPEFERQEVLDQFELAFDLSKIQVLQPDLNAEFTRWDMAVRGGWSMVSTAKEATGQEVLPGDDVYLRPLNILPTPAGVPSLPGGMATRSLKGYGTKASLTDQQRELLLLERELGERLEAEFTDELETAFVDLGDRVATAYLERIPAVAARNGNGHGPEYKQTEEDAEILRRILFSFDLAEWQNTVLLGAYGGHYLRTLTGTVQNINLTMRLGINLPDAVARRVVAEGGTRLGLLDIEKDTRQAIFRSLHDGRSLGEGPDALARRIRDQVGAGRWTTAGPRYRALVIARTETKYSQGISAIEAYERSEAVSMALLVDNQTGFGDADCTARDGMVVSFAEARRILSEEHPNFTLNISPYVEA